MQYNESDFQGEPTLTEVMSDPMVKLVITRDGQTPEQVWHTIEDVQAGLRRRGVVPTGSC